MGDNDQFLWNVAAILLTLASLFLAISWWGGTSMVGLIPPFVSQFAAIVCASLALIILLILSVKNIIGRRKRASRETTTPEYNITIDTRDFISMDTKQIKAVFYGLEKIIRHNQEKQNGTGGGQRSGKTRKDNL
jgi:hypothetical protein